MPSFLETVARAKSGVQVEPMKADSPVRGTSGTRAAVSSDGRDLNWCGLESLGHIINRVHPGA